ncbi:MAG: A/G-specific adenine glycosylase [Gemmataceae bacterium]
MTDAPKRSLPELPEPGQAHVLAEKLVRWYARHRRPLPWRRTCDPYAIWVSEVMLQQTQVATVIPYYQRFLKRFPTPQALARASADDVLRVWQGLGYYRRALNLWSACRRLMQRHRGQWPQDRQSWCRLPGVGQYTAGAILSQAFGQKVPAVDANAARVLARLFGLQIPLDRSAARRWLVQAAERLLERQTPGECNQALMELGALVCTPAEPRCPTCPLASECWARQHRRASAIPVKTRRPIVRREEVALLLHRRGRFLLTRSDPSGTDPWPGLWHFPAATLRESTSARRVLGQLAHRFGCRIGAAQELFGMQYRITRHVVAVRVFQAQAHRVGDRREGTAWLRLSDLCRRPVCAPHLRIARRLGRLARRHRQ